MQIARLFKIVYILMDKKSVTASELAARFEVSTRTVYRDIDVLAAAGIPVYSSKGKGGGIRLTDSFVLNKSLLSENEQNDILAALVAMGAARYPGGAEVLDKLGSIFKKSASHWIEVDFSDWSHEDNETFELLKNAILNKKLATFDYYSSYGEKTVRTVEPLLLWFKHKNWYLKAFDREKQDERVFKLSRLKRLSLTGEAFEPRTRPENTDVPREKRHTEMVTVRLKVDASQLYRVYDEFDESMIQRADDGSFICEATFPEDEWVYGFILSFGHFAKVLEPAHIRDSVKERLKNSMSLYL